MPLLDGVREVDIIDVLGDAPLSTYLLTPQFGIPCATVNGLPLSLQLQCQFVPPIVLCCAAKNCDGDDNHIELFLVSFKHAHVGSGNSGTPKRPKTD